jgi:hypothetical protein
MRLITETAEVQRAKAPSLSTPPGGGQAVALNLAHGGNTCAFSGLWQSMEFQPCADDHVIPQSAVGVCSCCCRHPYAFFNSDMLTRAVWG